MAHSGEHKHLNFFSLSWSEQSRLEKLALPDPKKILKKFWEKKILNYDKTSVEAFKNYLLESACKNNLKLQKDIETLFENAIYQRISLDKFSHDILLLGSKYVHDMNGAEKLIIVPERKIQDLAHALEVVDIHNMKQFMEDQKMTASVTLRADAGVLTSVVHTRSKQKNVFAMHSIGKVFTGMLVLILVRIGIVSVRDLNSPVQLDEAVLNQLPHSVQEQLKKVTLHQMMTHTAGLGDYLETYEKTLAKGTIPDIKHVEDFVQFIDPKIFPIGEVNYSNAGILLVGLALKHAYENHIGEACDYNDILRKFILDPAGIKCFSPWRPEHSSFNPADPAGPNIVGSPAGGYWTTAEDLAKFGCWIYETCKSDPQLKRLIQKYGQEFYPEPERELIAHGGAISSSSAFFSVSLKTGAVMAILSDQPNTAFILNEKIQKNIMADHSLDVTDIEMATSAFSVRHKR